jgi:DNA-directed RNA polymerase specialized sigma24 family protein
MGIANRVISALMAGTTDMSDDEFLESLTALEEVLADNGRRATLIKKRIAQLRRLRARDVSYTELVTSEDEPLIVQLLTESSAALDTCGANVRRAEAQALYAEGLTMEQIARRFGVTRQRVSALLRKAPKDSRPGT